MKFHLFLNSSSFLSTFFFIFLLALNILQSLSDLDSYKYCNTPFKCGNFEATYPFWGASRPEFCGHPQLMLGCEDGYRPTIVINSVKYNVLRASESTQILWLLRSDYQFGFCQADPTDTTLLYPLLQYSPDYELITFHYNCPKLPAPMVGQFSCNESHGFVETRTRDQGECASSVAVPIKRDSILPRMNLSVLQQGLRQGFEVKWNVRGMECADCIKSNGSCGYDRVFMETVCHCLDDEQSDRKTVCPASKIGSQKRHSRTRIFISLGGSTGGIIVVICIFLIGRKQKSKLFEASIFSVKQSQRDQKVEAFVRSYGSLCPQTYSYYDIKKMTNFFSKKLGQGGFGDVYKGELRDGHLVAVKLLKESKGDGEEFINEVASISRTSHVNIVTFLGFCFEKKKRALVYEFMPNGSLDKYIYDRQSAMTITRLAWKTMYKIGVGIARGLEYLHRGCNTRIVHFDIKPHNILLDEDFCPKISDFGLSKLCKTKESIISMLGGRGTPGYIAPEIFYRNFGQVSHKSDVYSYGMMIIEMVVGRKNMNGRGSEASEIYFPDWIYKYTEPGNELHGVIIEEEKEIAKKMIWVSLWCIQPIPSDRPSISKVIEMLEGRVEDLEMPPKPCFLQPAAPIRQCSQPSTLLSSSSASDFVCRVGSCMKVSDNVKIQLE